MRTQLVVFHGLFGGWGWECFDERGELVAESKYPFDNREECMEDARRHPALVAGAADTKPSSAAMCSTV